MDVTTSQYSTVVSTTSAYAITDKLNSSSDSISNISTAATQMSTTVTMNDTEVITQALWLQTSQDVIIYASVVSGILGFLLLLAAVAWVIEQSEHFSDPVAHNITRILQKSREDVQDSDQPQLDFPPNSPDLPGWMQGRPVDSVDAMEMHEIAPENNNEVEYDEPLYESYNESVHREVTKKRSYGYINPAATTADEQYQNSPTVQRNPTIRPTPASLMAEMKMKFNSRKAIGLNRRSTKEGPHTYETKLDDIEDAYNQSLYSNDEIAPEIPRRDPI